MYSDTQVAKYAKHAKVSK